MGAAALLSKVALVILTPAVTCLALCTFGVEPMHGWMMRHDCPLAKMAMHPPTRPVPMFKTTSGSPAPADVSRRLSSGLFGLVGFPVRPNGIW